MKRHILYLFATLLCLACSDDPFGDDGNNINSDAPFQGGVVTLTIAMPAYSEANVKSRSVSDYGLTDKTLQIVAYAKNGSFLSKSSATLSSLSVTGSVSGDTETMNSEKVTVTLPKYTYYVDVVANAPTDVTKDDFSGKLNETTTNTDLNSTTETVNPVWWGYSTITALLNSSSTITLCRQCAKVDISESLSDFSISEVLVKSLSKTGTVAPTRSNYENGVVTAATLPISVTTEDKTISATTTGNTSSATFYAYESEAKCTHLVIKGTYGTSSERYYRVDFITNSSGSADTYLPLLRNHHYTVNISSVSDNDGYATAAEAEAALPENRLRAEVVDHNLAIVDMIACKDYYLGISDVLTVPATIASDITYSFSAVMAYNSTYGKSYPVTITVTDNASGLINTTGLTDNKIDTGIGTTVPTDNSTGTIYTPTIPLNNNTTAQERTATITVAAGDLTRTLVVKQEAYDFFNDPNRPIYLFDSDNAFTSLAGYDTSVGGMLYATFLKEHLNGASKAAMGDTQRDDGLIFSFGTNTYYYKIKKLDGDQLTNSNTSKITVTEDNGYWKVTLASSETDQSIWKSSFTITNSSGVEIPFTVYHSGIISKLLGEAYVTQQPATSKTWYYYEVVKVHGSTSDYYMLDRNLGATSNRFYSQSVSEFKENTGAIGGYYEIKNSHDTNDKTATLSDAISPTDFNVPIQSQLSDIINAGNLVVEQRQSPILRDEYNCIVIKTDGSESLLSEVYIPVSGYYELGELKDDTRARLWTKTPLSGAQGFDTSSTEYGFWYLYLDVYGKIIDYTPMRFVSGSAGKLSGTYRYMPVRCVCAKKTYTTIYYVDEENWGKASAYVYDNNNNLIKAFPGLEMDPCGVCDNSKTVYKVTFTSNSTSQWRVIFTNGEKEGSQHPAKNESGWSIENGKYYNKDGKMSTAPTYNSNYYTPQLDSKDEISIFLQLPVSVSATPYTHIYDENNNKTGDWPGKTMTFKGYTSDFKGKIYKWTYDATSTDTDKWKVIFNLGNGGNQYGDKVDNYNYTNNGYYIWDGNSNKTAEGAKSVYVVTVTSDSVSSSTVRSRSVSTVKIGSAYWQQQAQKSKWYSIGK